MVFWWKSGTYHRQDVVSSRHVLACRVVMGKAVSESEPEPSARQTVNGSGPTAKAVNSVWKASSPASTPTLPSVFLLKMSSELLKFVKF